MSAAIASLKPVGIDIQYIVPKITRIAPKFMNEVEVSNIDKMDTSLHLDVMHIIWGAKESLFKAYGKKSVDFKKHMTLHIKEWNGEAGNFSGQFNKADYRKNFRLQAMKILNHILVYAEETNEVIE